MSPRTQELIDPSYPLLEANRMLIESINRETFPYGPSNLDVYYPTDVFNTLTPPSILIFFYGGGLTHGSRSSPPSNLVHNNLGAFFASRGILTVIPDYRLVPSITFPQGSEDVRDAIKWTTDKFPESAARLFIMGHSAGGLHIAGLLFTPMLFSPISQAIRGVILIGVPVTVPAGRTDFYAAACLYYGNHKAIYKNQPSTLLQCSGEDLISGLPPVRALVAGSEPRYISTGMRAFAQEFKRKGGMIEEFVLDGHDHLSPVLALSSGSGEEWGTDVVKWISDIVSKFGVNPDNSI